MSFDLIDRLFSPLVTAWLDVRNAWTKQQGFAQATLTDAPTIAWDGETQQCAVVTLGGNRTLGAISNPVAGYTYILICKQDATGGRSLSYNSIYTFASGSGSLSSAANAVDMFCFYYDGLKMRGTFNKGFA